MKKIFYFLTILLMPLFAMAAKEDAFGRWITETSSAGANRIIVDIYEKNGKVYGKIYQLTERFDDKGELKKDVNNPDKSKQSRTLEGIDFVSGFVYNDSNNTYEDGKIYDPSTGKTYSCYMVLQENGTLKVRGHLPGLTLIGKTQTWKKYK